MNIRKVSVLLAGMCLFLVTGCASTTQMVPRPAAASDPTLSYVQVERSLGFGAWANGIKVTDTGTYIGSVGPNGILFWSRTPGQMTISSEPKISLGPFDTLSLPAEQGKVYRVKAKMPFWYPFSSSGLSVIGVNSLSPGTVSVNPAPKSAPPSGQPVESSITPKPTSTTEDIPSRLKKLKELKEAGVLTDQEYETRRKVLVDQL